MVENHTLLEKKILNFLRRCWSYFAKTLLWLWLMVFFTVLNLVDVSAQELFAVHDRINKTFLYDTGLKNSQELQILADWYFNEAMQNFHVPGAVIAIVKDNSILLKKGYGFSNLESHVTVSPEETRFRVGSITKLVTATAVMQLVERKQLNLEDKVNDYLQHFKIKNPFPHPVRVKHLLTHSAGFDHHQSGKHARNVRELKPLREFLKKQLPQIVFNPGEYVSYSNYGISLAGYLVEEISGQDFSQYVNENIFLPLEMSHSGFNLPEDSESNLAVGYKFMDGYFHRFPVDYLNHVPAGALLTTAEDMAHFMIAHLQEGRYFEQRILQEATIEEMHRPQFRAHAQMPGWCYGFYEDIQNGQRAIMHSGFSRGFSSLLYLIPDEKIGIFMSGNCNNSEIFQNFVRVFLDRYFPASPPTVQTVAPNASPDNYARFTGKYQFNNLPKFNIARLSNLLEHRQEIRVYAEAGGILKVYLPSGTKRILEVQPLLFKILDEEGYIAFRENDRGEITHMFIHSDKPLTLDKLTWWDAISFQLNFLRAFYVVFTLSIFLFLFFFLKNKPALKLPYLLGLLICTCNLLFLFGLDEFFRSGTLRYGVSTPLIVLLCLALISVVLSAGMPLITIFILKTPRFSLLQKLHFSLFTFSTMLFISFLNYWNLIGFNF